MRTNMWARVICAILTLTAFAGTIFFHYCYEDGYIFNICLAIFGSSLLTYINALISYKFIRREAVMQYLTDLRRYRQKFKNMQAAPNDVRNTYLEDLSDFFYELHSDYAKIQHLCPKWFIHKHMSYILDCSFQNIVDVQNELNIRQFNFVQQKSKIDESADMIEKLAKNKMYLDSSQKARTHS